MPANQWVRLLKKTKKRLRLLPSPTKQSVATVGKVASHSRTTTAKHARQTLEEAKPTSPVAKPSSSKEKNLSATKPPSSKETKSSAKLLSSSSSTETTKRSANHPSKQPSSVGTFKNGKRVYAAWWETSTRSGPPVYYPGKIASSKIVNGSTVLYDIHFDDGDELDGIDSSLVISSRRYRKKNRKTALHVGDEVYSAWWGEDAKRRVHCNYDYRSIIVPTWHPGVITKVTEDGCGGQYGPFLLYEVAFDDGDKLDEVQDYFVMKKSDYIISIRKTDVDNGNVKWIGVTNKLDEESVDDWAKKVGWYVATIDGEEQSFSNLSGELFVSLYSS